MQCIALGCVPFSNAWRRSTFTRSSVCPWLLWIEIAHDKIKGISKRHEQRVPSLQYGK